MTITNINHITLAVTDIHHAFSFYKDVLGFKPLVKGGQGAYFLIGDFWFCLNVDLAGEPQSCYTHYAFSVSSEDFEMMADKIQNYGTHVFKENTSPSESLYFLDPDGHKLEIHVGNSETRIAAKNANPGICKNVEWFV